MAITTSIAASRTMMVVPCMAPPPANKAVYAGKMDRTVVFIKRAIRRMQEEDALR